MTAVGYGIGLAPVDEVGELVELAATAERLGYRSVWVNDDRLERDPFTVLAAIAEHTDRVLLGPGVTNPYSRHPALVAAAVGTLHELSGGRAVLGLGAGGTNHRALGIERRAPATALREAIAVTRGLWAGQSVTVDGQIVRARDAQLGFEVPPPGPALHVGARGPKVLELAGERADGVIVGNVASPAGWDYALGRIEAGATRGGGDMDELELTAWLYTSVADDEEAALDAIRPMAATSLATSRPVLAELGIELPSDFEAVMEAAGWRLDPDVTARAGALLTPDLVRRFGLAGTAAGCRTALSELLGAVPAIDNVVIVPFPAAGGGTVRETVERFIGEVVEVHA